MTKLVRNQWQSGPGACARAEILRHDRAPEGLDVDRLRFSAPEKLSLGGEVGHVVSLLKGSGRLHEKGQPTLSLVAGVHLYLPPGSSRDLEAEAGTELVRVSSPSASQTRGKQLLLRDEAFVAAAAVDGQSMRWILTPQYLSRRIFLHHDQALLSKSGNPVSWFRTTMFDVSGLPPNEEGESVFKMSYNSRTEFNVCYDVAGEARVRMATHPYTSEAQAWLPWQTLDGETTYHLDEPAGGPDEERYTDPANGSTRFLRNKHEVYSNGQVSLCCLFDPAPTGVERHRPGEYSDYEPFSDVEGRDEYRAHQREIAALDEMVDRLSMAKARGELKKLEGTPIWERYLKGHAAQRALETELIRTLQREGKGRERVLMPWVQR